MPLTWKDRIKVASVTTGTGTLTLGAAASGYQTFAAGDDGKVFPYVIVDGTAWETGYGTYTHSGTTFARTLRTDSSTGGALNVTTAAYVFVDLVSTIADGHELATQALTPGGRLTLESGVPVSTTDQTAKTNIYYTPCVHDIINLWDGNRWKPITFTEYTLALGTLTNAKPYDVFAYLNSGALALEVLVWTNDTTRATAVTIQDGRYCKSGDKTRLLLGTFYTTATTTTEDSSANRLLSNVYNRMPKQAIKSATASHTYSSSTVRAWNNSTANRFTVCTALAQSVMCALREWTESPVSSNPQIYLGHNSTAGGNLQLGHLWADAHTHIAGASQAHSLSPGYNYFQILENEWSGATVTFSEAHASAVVLC